MNIDHPYSHILEKNTYTSLLARLSLLYLIILFFINPLYKFCEIYYDFPVVNISAIRAVLALLVFSILLLYIVINIKRLQFLNRAILFLMPGIVCLILVTIIFFISYFRVLDYSPQAFETYLVRVDACLIGYPILFVAGIFFDLIDSKKINKLFLSLWLLFSFFVLFNAQLFISSFFIYENVPGKIINYILISGGYLFFVFFALTAVRSNFIKIIIWVVSFACMFLMPSRSNTFGFLFATIIPVIFYLVKRQSISLLVILLTSAILIIVVTFAIGNSTFSLNNELFENSRVINSDISNDESLNARQEIARTNYENLKQTWFFGDFMGDIRMFGEDGNETHSYISFLEQFGLIPFLLMVCSVLILIYFLFLLRSDSSDIYISTLLLSLFFIPLMIFTKGFTSNLIWFMIPRIVVYFFSLRKSYQLLN